MSSSPPEGFEARPLQAGDAAAVAELLFAFDSTHLDEVTDRVSEQDVLDWWRRHDLVHESVAAFDDRSLVAFGLLEAQEEGALELYAFVDPRRHGRGLESFLLAWAEVEAKGRFERLRAAITPRNRTAMLSLVQARGFSLVRHFYRMVVDLDTPPEQPEWPNGLTVSSMQVGEERVLYEVMEEAFAEEWGRPARSFEDWQQTVFAQESFDPSLCFLVREGGEVVAAETCSQRFGMGWIGSVGVRKPWRRRGLGRALLLQGFAELYRRGEQRIGLGVDASNPTGATRLYEAVGMRVAWQADLYEKAL